MLYVNNIICEFHCEVLGLFTRLTILYKKRPIDFTLFTRISHRYHQYL